MIAQKDAEFFDDPMDRAVIVAIGALESLTRIGVGEAEAAQRRRPRNSVRYRWPCRTSGGQGKKMTAVHRPRPRSISKPFQQTLDIVELHLRAGAFPSAAAQLIEDLAGFLQSVLIGDLYISLIESAVVRHRPAKGVAIDLVPRLAVGGSDITIVRIAAAEAPLHLLGEFARRLLQLIEGFGLGPNRFTRLAALQCVGRIAHRPFGAPEGLGNFPEAVAEPAHHFAQHSP